MDLTINGNDQYTLVGSRPVIFYWEKQAVEHLRTTFFFSPPTQSLLFLSLPLWHTASQWLSQALSFSLLQMGPTHSHMPQLYNILHIKAFNVI